MENKRQITSVVIHYEQMNAILESFDNERLGIIMRSFFAWCFTGKEYDGNDGMIKFAFLTLKTQAKIDFAKYDVIIEKRREAGRKHTGNQYTRMKQMEQMEQVFQNGTNGTINNNDNDNVNYNINDNVNRESIKRETKADKSATRSQFQKPTIEECFSYCKELGLSTYDYNGQQKSQAQTTAEAFFDYYESNGWKVGKNTMKNWRAALNGWIRRYAQYKKTGGSRKSVFTDEQTDALITMFTGSANN